MKCCVTLFKCQRWRKEKRTEGEWPTAQNDEEEKMNDAADSLVSKRIIRRVLLPAGKPA